MEERNETKKQQGYLDDRRIEFWGEMRGGVTERTNDMRSDHLGAYVVLEKASNVLVVLVPLLEPEVELGSGDGIEASELQGEVGRHGRGGGQGQEGGSVGSNLEGDLGPEGDSHDRGGLGRRRAGWGGAEPRGERLGGRSGSKIRRVDGDSGNIRNGRESGRAESRGGRRGYGGDTSRSRPTSGW